MAEVHNLWQKILKLLSKILKSDIVNTQTAKMLSKILKNRDVNTQHTQKRSKSSLLNILKNDQNPLKNTHALLKLYSIHFFI